MSDDVHHGIAAGTSLVFFSGAHVFTCGYLFFSLFGFVRCASVLRMNLYFGGIVLFSSCKHSASAVFATSFLFLLRFVSVYFCLFSPLVLQWPSSYEIFVISSFHASFG